MYLLHYFKHLKNFANEYEINILEDRRIQASPVEIERRSYSLAVTLLSLIMIKSVALAGDINVRQIEDKDIKTQEQNVQQLLGWIRFKMSQHEFEVGYEMPKIQRLPRSEMYKLTFGKNIPRLSAKTSANVYGLYNYEDKMIYMLNSIDINSTKGKAILLHELVHYLQYQNGHDHEVECKNRLEYLAYSLEASYLKEHGEKIGISQNHLRRVVQC